MIKEVQEVEGRSLIPDPKICLSVDCTEPDASKKCPLKCGIHGNINFFNICIQFVITLLKIIWKCSTPTEI